MLWYTFIIIFIGAVVIIVIAIIVFFSFRIRLFQKTSLNEEPKKKHTKKNHKFTVYPKGI